MRKRFFSPFSASRNSSRLIIFRTSPILNGVSKLAESVNVFAAGTLIGILALFG